MNKLERPSIQRFSLPDITLSPKPFTVSSATSSVAKYLEDNLERILKIILETTTSAPMAFPKTYKKDP